MSNPKKIRQLIKLIDKYDESYYNKNESLVTDSEYDALRDELGDLTKAFTPTTKGEDKLKYQAEEVIARIGAPVKKTPWKKYSHEVPMASLNKVNTKEQLDTWYNNDCEAKGKLFVTEKLDGASVSLKYENGILTVGATRGDGEIGEDITKNVVKMKGVPRQLKYPETIHVRGEIVLFHSDHKKHFPSMANVRNAASGIAKRIDGGGQEHLTVIAYAIDGIDNINTEKEIIKSLQERGFLTPYNIVVKSLDDVQKIWQEYIDSKRESLDYDIDGLVIRINELNHQYALGEKGRGPKGAAAYKFETPEAKTEIIDIVCQVGDTGQITPVAICKPVNLLGTTVRRASLHNFSNIQTLGVDIGATILIKKANDVIPFIIGVVKSTGTVFSAPNKCPYCKSKTEKKGEYLRCSNKFGCRPQIKGRMSKWIKEHGILEWGDAILDKLIDAGLVKDVDGLYRLTKDQIAGLERMGERSAEVLISELDKYRAITLESFIGGLCIDQVATSTTKKLVDAGYNTYDLLMNITVEQAAKVNGFGDIRAEAFVNGLKENKSRIEAILAAGIKIRERTKGCLTGKSFCFTGKSTLLRPQLQKLVKENGGDVKKDVGKDVDYLVLADPNSTTSKAQAARKLGTKTISEEQFMAMIK